MFVQIYLIRIINTVSNIRNPKLNSEKSLIYFIALPGLCFVYSLKVIRLASEEISVPTPPIFTPRRSPIQAKVTAITQTAITR